MAKQLFGVLLGVLLHGAGKAQNIYVHTTDGATHTFPLIDVRSITFDDHVMNLNLITADTVSWNISVIRYYEYDRWYVSVPEGLIMDQNGIRVYPNPSNGSFTITYGLTADAEVNAAVYDLNGRLVAPLFSGKQLQGDQQLTCDLHHSALASGTYVCSVKIGDARFNKLIILNKNH